MMRHSMLCMYNFVRSLLFIYPLDKSTQLCPKDNNYCGIADSKVNFVSFRLG